MQSNLVNLFQVSFVEIYNEGIYDLLASSDRRNASKLRIREDASGNVYVKVCSLCVYFISSPLTQSIHCLKREMS